MNDSDSVCVCVYIYILSLIIESLFEILLYIYIYIYNSIFDLSVHSLISRTNSGTRPRPELELLVAHRLAALLYSHIVTVTDHWQLQRLLALPVVSSYTGWQLLTNRACK